MTATCSKTLDKRPKEAGLEGRHPTCSRLGSREDTYRTLGGPRVQAGWRQLGSVGPMGLREAVFIYCCSEAALLASGQGGPQQGGESQEGSQRSESREDASLEQPVMQTPGGLVGRVEVWSLVFCGFLSWNPVPELERVKLQAMKPPRDSQPPSAPELPQPHDEAFPSHGRDHEVLLPRCLCGSSPAGSWLHRSLPQVLPAPFVPPRRWAWESASYSSGLRPFLPQNIYQRPPLSNLTLTGNPSSRKEPIPSLSRCTAILHPRRLRHRQTGGTRAAFQRLERKRSFCFLLNLCGVGLFVLNETACKWLSLEEGSSNEQAWPIFHWVMRAPR